MFVFGRVNINENHAHYLWTKNLINSRKETKNC